MTAASPTVDFFGTQISKLIIGGNAISGNSHRTPELDAAMVNYFTTARIKETLHSCERAGVNTFQFRGDGHVHRVLREYRNEGGGLHWICQTASEYANLRAVVQSSMAYRPIAFYLHGTRGDNYWKTGQVDQLKADLAVLRETGLPVGLGSHMPEVLTNAEEHGWDVDFYMTSMYDVYKSTPGWRESFLVSGVRLPEVYEEEDRDRVLTFVRQTAKPCLLFKVLAAGHQADTAEHRRAAFRHAIEHSKPGDAMVVGMFPKDSDEIAENAAVVRSLIEDSRGER